MRIIIYAFDLELVLRNTRKAFLQLYTVAGHNYAD